MNNLNLENIKVKTSTFNMDIDLTLECGTFVSIIGPSGCGKSTLLDLIYGLTIPSLGRIMLDGKELTHLKPNKRPISLVRQDSFINPNFTVEKIIKSSIVKNKVKRKELKQTIQSWASKVNLDNMLKRKDSSLSMGERKRVEIAKALSENTSILLLDDPFSSLNTPLRRKIRDEVRRLHDENGKTITILVTSDREEALSISDKVIVMNEGHIEAIGTPEEIYNKSKTLFTAYSVGDGTMLPSSLFISTDSYDTIFFRPEAVQVRENTFYCVPTMYLKLEHCEILTSEYLGSRYILGLTFGGREIIATAFEKPQSKFVNLYVKKTLISYYKEGNRVEIK